MPYAVSYNLGDRTKGRVSMAGAAKVSTTLEQDQAIAVEPVDDIASNFEAGEPGTGAALRALEAIEPGYYAAASAGVVSPTVTYATNTAS